MQNNVRKKLNFLLRNVCAPLLDTFYVTEDYMASIGFIGLGTMGLPMAKRLCSAGHSVKVAVHKNLEPANAVAGLGGIIVPSFADVVRDVEYIITIVPEDTQLRELFSNEAVVGGIRPETILIEMTSSSPQGMKELAALLAKRGIACFDAPVSGGVAGAVNGTLTIMGGGDAAVLAKIEPVLKIMASKIILAGGMGAGKATKAVNQMLVGVNGAMVAEALALARKLEIDPEVMFDVISFSSGNSAAFSNKFKKMVQKDYSGGFKSTLLRKDMRIALAEAGDIPLPLTGLAYQMYQMISAADADADFSVVSKVYEK